MSQVDEYAINGTSPLSMATLEARLDALFGAAASYNRGATAPTNPFEGMLWWDSSAAPDALKRYTVAAGWVSILTINITTGALAFTGALAAANNLSDLASAATAKTNLGLGTGDSPQFTGIELGHASDTTLTRSSAGNVAVEGNLIYRAGGTDVPVTDGGTGASTAADARTNLGLGTAATANTGTSGTAVALLDGDNTWSGSQRGAITTDNDGSFDQNAANNFFCTTSGSTTLTFTNHTAGQSGLILFVNSSNHSVAAAATTKIKAADLTTISATGTYLLTYFDNGTNAYVVASGALS